MVKCHTLEILQCLWKEYCSIGHLNAVSEKYFMTNDIQDRFDVNSITLETTILKEEYLACKLSLMDLAGDLSQDTHIHKAVDSL